MVRFQSLANSMALGSSSNKNSEESREVYNREVLLQADKRLSHKQICLSRHRMHWF